MDRDRTAYEREALEAITAPFRRGPSLSDSDRDAEYRAQAIFFPALEQFIAACEVTKELSPMQADAIDDLLKAVGDGAQGQLAWDEKINNARRGWDQ